MPGRITGRGRERFPALTGLLASVAGGLAAIFVGVIIAELREINAISAAHDRELDEHARRLEYLERPPTRDRDRWLELYANPARRAH